MEQELFQRLTPAELARDVPEQRRFLEAPNMEAVRDREYVSTFGAGKGRRC